MTAMPAPATPIRVVRIDFQRAEGYAHECGLRAFFSWEDFNNRVRRAAPDGEDPTPYLEQFDENYPGMRARATWLLNGYDLGR